MLTNMKNLIFALFAFCAIAAHAQDNGTVIIARKKLYAAGDISLFMDGKFIGNMDNNAFTTLSVPAGAHKFHAQWDGSSAKDAAMKDAVEINVAAGSEYYLKAAKEERGLKSVLLLEEITASTWAKVKPDLKEVKTK